MPRRCPTDARLPGLLRAQDWVVSAEQAFSLGLTPAAVHHRLRTGQWQVLLPGVYLAHPGDRSRRQALIAAQLFAGPRSAIDGVDACRFHGIRAVPADDALVHVVVPWGEPVRSRGFVVVRRTVAPLSVVATERLRYVDAATAVIAATRRMTRDRLVLAVLSDALQRRITTYDELVRAHIQGPPRGARATDASLEALAAGARSLGEVDFLRLVAASTVLPSPMCNALLRLPDGRLISPDALFLSSGVVHETNGRQAHRREDLFEDMQVRHDAMTAAGLTVLHNPPRRLALQGRLVIAEVERCHARLDGRGLPDGVKIVRVAA